MKQVELCGKKVRINEDEMISLTDMWKASGRSKPIASFVDGERVVGLEQACCKSHQLPYRFRKQEL